MLRLGDDFRLVLNHDPVLARRLGILRRLRLAAARWPVHTAAGLRENLATRKHRGAMVGTLLDRMERHVARNPDGPDLRPPMPACCASVATSPLASAGSTTPWLICKDHGMSTGAC